jgi:pyruvate dehydrogenase E2 component (dihydrolipoamide acetyltransferase)
VHAGPSVRRLARELGIDLGQVRGSGPKGRITRDDLLGTIRGPATGDGAAPAAAAAPTSGIPEIPAQDFSKFGETETVALGRIKKLSGPHLYRSWLNVPHVTHSDEADITEIDAYRKELDTAAKAEGYRVTLLAFLMKAAVSALRAFPEVNASLSPDKGSLILKRYYNIGIAVDTPGGLVVPVVTDVDRKGVIELSKNLGELSGKARDGKLSAAEMSGGTFTISSLGGIGGTGFTPIVNAPELAILGVVRSKMAPVWDGESFVPRMMLPLSLSYDHRVIDGAMAARFTRHLCSLLEDLRKLVL